MAVEADALSAMEEARRSIPRVIRRLAEHHHVTGAELAPLLGVTRAAVSSRLTGKTVIKSEELAALAHYFGVPVLVFYLAPDEALRWVIDHPERRPVWLADHLGKSRKSWSGLLAGQDALSRFLSLPVSA